MSYDIRYVDVPANESTRDRAEHDSNITELEKIGSGLYGKVYSSDLTPYVVKVFRGMDIGYMKLLEFRKILNIHNRFLPRVYDVVFYRHLEEDGSVSEDANLHTGVVKMEKLKHRRDYQVWDGKFATLARFLGSKIQHPEDYNGFHNPEFEETAALIRLVYEETIKEDDTMSYDIHSGNIMLRKGQIVITDPIA